MAKAGLAFNGRRLWAITEQWARLSRGKYRDPDIFGTGRLGRRRLRGGYHGHAFSRS